MGSQMLPALPILALLLLSSVLGSVAVPYYSAPATPISRGGPTTIPHRRYFPPKTAPANPFCPRDKVKFGACLDLLGDVGGLVIGAPPRRSKCCALLEGLADAEAALCLCTTIKESALGITTQWSVALSLLASACSKNIPDGFKCI